MFSETTFHFFDLDGGPLAPKRAREEETPPSPPQKPKLTAQPLTAFFKKADAPVFAKVGPPNPYKEFGKETKEVKYSGRTRVVTLVRVQSSGKVVGDCRGCTKASLRIGRFRPPECNKNGRRVPAFDAAVARLEEAVRKEDAEEGKIAVKEVAVARNAFCVSCQEVDSTLSPAVQACKDFWVATRREACERQDGCANKECPARGMDAELVLQWDHKYGARDEDVERRKTHMLSDYTWWSCNGGVEAMRDEYAKGGRFICGCCHALVESSTQSRRIADPARVEELPDGKPRGTKEEVAQYERKRQARIRAPKYAYVDAEKRRRGKCFYCEREVKPGEEVCFEYDHRDATTKWFSKTSKGLVGGVAGLCNSTAAADDPHKSPDVFGRLDAETDLCLLSCINCHKLRTHYPDSDVWRRVLAAKEEKAEQKKEAEGRGEFF
jgi:hypothetical protein